MVLVAGVQSALKNVDQGSLASIFTLSKHVQSLHFMQLLRYSQKLMYEGVGVLEGWSATVHE